MKKVMTIILMIVLMMCLVGCGDDTNMTESSNVNIAFNASFSGAVNRFNHMILLSPLML